MGRDVKGKNQGMDGTCSADPGTRMAAEERATEERTTDERTMEDIIKDATDRYLDSFPEKEITVSDLEDMVSRHDRKTRKRTVRAAGFAALFIIVAAGIFFISGGYFDVGADKNPKEQIVKDDMVVSKDGGYGDDGGEDELVITEWDDIESIYKTSFKGILIPSYIPKEYKFKELRIENEADTYMYKYVFESNNSVIEIHEYYCSMDIASTESMDNEHSIDCSRGKIYKKNMDGTAKATIQLDDSMIVEIWSTLPDKDIIKIVDYLE